ncbi:MAG: hypothetical protein RR891_08130 [Clostridium sp.]|uniref:hypothetical protein n=1 Tax=Clostridium sp. TaxID=1506 RepID=UPI00304074F7
MNKKRIVGVLSGAIILSSMATVAFAGNMDFSFECDPNIDEGRVYSEKATKDDGENFWYVTTTDGNLDIFDKVFYGIAKEDGTRVSAWCKAKNGSSKFLYDANESIMWKKYKLLGDTDRYKVKLSGKFCP